MQVGGAIVFDLVEYQPTACIGILKLADKRCATEPLATSNRQRGTQPICARGWCGRSEVDKVRSAATLLMATSDGRACKLETLGTARELQSLR